MLNGANSNCHPGKRAAFVRDPVGLGPGSPLRYGRDDKSMLSPVRCAERSFFR